MPDPRLVRRLGALLAAAGLTLGSPLGARAAQPKITPEKSEELRAAARVKAEGAGGLSAQADVLFRSGEELGDPVLMLDGADKLARQADGERSTEIAEAALGQVAVALDVVTFMAGDGYARTRWQPVADDVVAAVVARAQTLRTELQNLIDEIEAERAAAAAAAAAAANRRDEPDDARKPGTGMIAGGSIALTLGLGGVGLMAAGLAMGAQRQREAEALELPAQLDELERLDEQGARANMFAYVGGAVAAVGLAVGLGLIIAGVKKRRAAGSGAVETSEGAPERAVVTLLPQPAGAALVGRF